MKTIKKVLGLAVLLVSAGLNGEKVTYINTLNNKIVLDVTAAKNNVSYNLVLEAKATDTVDIPDKKVSSITITETIPGKKGKPDTEKTEIFAVGSGIGGTGVVLVSDKDLNGSENSRYAISHTIRPYRTFAIDKK